MNYHHNNTSIKYKDDLHIYKIIQTSMNTFKTTYTQHTFLHKYHIYHTSRYKGLVIPILSTHMGSQKKRLDETLLMSTKLNNYTGVQNIFTILRSKLCSYGHIIIPVSKIER